MDNQSYAGWSNYPTWAFNLHYGHHTEWLEDIIRGCSDKEELALALKDALAYDLENSVKASGLFYDFLMYAIDQIDFNELAEVYWDDLAETISSD